MKKRGDGWEADMVLSTGRIVPSNGEFRFSPEPNGNVAHGYDGTGVAVFDPDDPTQEARFMDDYGDVPLTKAERREIADYMIAAWRRWAKTGNP